MDVKMWSLEVQRLHIKYILVKEKNDNNTH